MPAPPTPFDHEAALVACARGERAALRRLYDAEVRQMLGVAPASACGADSKGKKEIVKYQADYIFWAAM